MALMTLKLSDGMIINMIQSDYVPWATDTFSAENNR